MGARIISVRLSAFEARALRALQSAGRPEGAKPRRQSDVIVDAILDRFATLEGGTRRAG